MNLIQFLNHLHLENITTTPSPSYLNIYDQRYWQWINLIILGQLLRTINNPPVVVQNHNYSSTMTNADNVKPLPTKLFAIVEMTNRTMDIKWTCNMWWTAYFKFSTTFDGNYTLYRRNNNCHYLLLLSSTKISSIPSYFNYSLIE